MKRVVISFRDVLACFGQDLNYRICHFSIKPSIFSYDQTSIILKYHFKVDPAFISYLYRKCLYFISCNINLIERTFVSSSSLISYWFAVINLDPSLLINTTCCLCSMRFLIDEYLDDHGIDDTNGEVPCSTSNFTIPNYVNNGPCIISATHGTCCH